MIDVNVVMSVDKLRQKVEANLHMRGKDIHVEAIEPDMYAAIDALADKLDRQVLKHKEKRDGAPPRRRGDQARAARRSARDAAAAARRIRRAYAQPRRAYHPAPAGGPPVV